MVGEAAGVETGFMFDAGALAAGLLAAGALLAGAFEAGALAAGDETTTGVETGAGVEAFAAFAGLALALLAGASPQAMPSALNPRTVPCFKNSLRFIP